MTFDEIVVPADQYECAKARATLAWAAIEAERLLEIVVGFEVTE